MRSAAHALCNSTVTGNNTWVTLHGRQRARHGRSGSLSPSICRARAYPPAAQHTVPARRAADPTNGQPELDADNISLYRHHRCLQALQRGTPQAGQGFSGVPRTHQFLVTLTVHTNKINPATTPTATSAAVMTNATPWSSSRETVNTPVHQAVIIHVVEGDLLSVQGLSS
jgi:hypothetical protein